MSDNPIMYSLWEKRWDALRINYIERLISITASPDPLPAIFPPYFPLLHKALIAFRDFADEHFRFFLNGFYTRDLPELQVSDKFSPDYILSQVLGRISEDVHLFQQMISQNQMGFFTINADKRLTTANDLATDALQPARAVGWADPSTSVFAYFERMLSVRVVPYAKVAWIGVPLTAIEAPRDLLAVPHEVGHYVYTNGRITPNGTTVRKLIWKWVEDVLQKPAFVDHVWLAGWAEEIFSDIYGCLVAGDGIAYSIQLLMDACSKGRQGLDDNKPELRKSHLLYDNKDHPLPYFRPEIYITVLKRLAVPNSAAAGAAAQLGKQWADKQAAYVADDSAYPQLYKRYLEHVFGTQYLLDLSLNYVGSSGSGTTYTSVFEVVAAAISAKLAEFVNVLLDGIGLGTVPGAMAWRNLVLPGYKPPAADFMGDLENALVSYQAVAAQATANGFQPIFWSDWRSDLMTMLPSHIPNPLTTPAGGSNHWTFYQWFHVFQGNGWTTEGPQTIPNVDPGKP